MEVSCREENEDREGTERREEMSLRGGRRDDRARPNGTRRQAHEREKGEQRGGFFPLEGSGEKTAEEKRRRRFQREREGSMRSIVKRKECEKKRRG